MAEPKELLSYSYEKRKRKMKDNHYDVILSSSNSIAPYPRLEMAARCLTDIGLCCLAVGWDREALHPTKERKGYVDIFRKHFRGKYGGKAQNVIGLLCWNLWLLYSHVKLRPKVIHAYDFDTVLPALVAKAFTKCGVVYDIADWYAQARGMVGLLRLLIEKIERWACRKADLVILAHEARIQQLGFNPKRWMVLYNSPYDCLSSLEKEISANDGYFAYVGILHPDRGLDQIIKVASDTGVKVILAGFGPLEGYCKKMTSAVITVEFLGRIPYERTLALEGNAIAIIALYDPKLPNNRLAAPNKLYEAMMLGRPLVTSKGTLVGEFVEKKKIGIAVTYGDVTELARAFKYLSDNPDECKKMGHRARELYEMQFSFSIQCEKLQKAYKELFPELF